MINCTKITAHDIPIDCLDSLYAWCNSRYFGNKLPVARMSWNSRLTSTFAFFEWESGSRFSGPCITVSKRLDGATYELLDTVVHEMIHVWQYSKYLRTGNVRFLDVVPERGYEFDSSWHGRYFYSWVDILNSKFPEMDLAASRSGYPTDLGIKIPRKYCIHIVFDGGSCIEEALFGCSSEITESHEKTLSQVTDLYGYDPLISLSVFSTESSDIGVFPQLTKSGRFKVGQTPSAHELNIIDRVLSHPSSTIPKSLYENYSRCLSGVDRTYSVSNDSKSMPLYIYYNHVSVRKPFKLESHNIDSPGTHRSSIERSLKSWSELSIKSALNSVPGRYAVFKLIQDVTAKNASYMTASQEFWHTLGPGRYTPSALLDELALSPIFHDSCRRQFADPEHIASQLRMVDTDYLISSFLDVKKAVSLCQKELTEEDLRAYMAHFAVPAQDEHIMILGNIGGLIVDSVGSIG